ncbi:VWA domain-containing protein [Saccharococcus thermophilus]|uniref:Ca-activated chloride channel family protein n=1 Tax=Saccharococcus thermophilus TaxID=29396 RepID=A0A846MI86_9BACL|nr:VWA domain-containing protein [Saccharococcus thermophilus]NIK13655.1 Ca-activated chloride channel family protein [Saccharococcus thermophilus]
MRKGTLRQILLITDGCSNHGEDPVAMAALAKEQGITVNVIGVLDQDTIDESGLREIEGIALSGGGISQVVYAKQLSQTVQMVTRKAMTQTLQGVVNKELKQILGSDVSLEDLPPEKRGQVMEVVDELGETVELEVLILIDTSGSMKTKLPTVKEALLDLSLSLNARTGDNRFAVFVFPGKRGDVEKIVDWTPRMEELSTVFPKLTSGGLTPTGPALREALAYFGRKRSLRSWIGDDESYFEESSM